MKILRLFLVSAIIILAINIESIFAANLNIKANVNGQNIESAKNRSSAIIITNPAVNFSWNVKNLDANTITLSKVTASYKSVIDKEIEFVSTIEPGEQESGSKSISLPSWSLSLKGYYNIDVYLYDSSDNVVARRNFWVLLGTGNPLGGMTGKAGLALGGVAVLTGMASAAAGSRPPKEPKIPEKTPADKPKKKRRKRGRILRGISTLAMMVATSFIMMALGITSLTLFLTTSFFAGIGDNVVVRLLAKALALEK